MLMQAAPDMLGPVRTMLGAHPYEQLWDIRLLGNIAACEAWLLASRPCLLPIPPNSPRHSGCPDDQSTLLIPPLALRNAWSRDMPDPRRKADPLADNSSRRAARKCIDPRTSAPCE
jgi:hypothetical protein